MKRKENFEISLFLRKPVENKTSGNACSETTEFKRENLIINKI